MVCDRPAGVKRDVGVVDEKRECFTSERTGRQAGGGDEAKLVRGGRCYHARDVVLAFFRKLLLASLVSPYRHILSRSLARYERTNNVEPVSHRSAHPSLLSTLPACLLAREFAFYGGCGAVLCAVERGEALNAARPAPIVWN